MAEYIKRIEAKGIYGRFDLHQEFTDGVNIIYGNNGTGKTTLLHILANILNGDYQRFAFLLFDSIDVELDDSTAIALKRATVPKEVITQFPVEVNGRIVEIREEKRFIDIPIITVYINGKPLEEIAITDIKEREREYLRRNPNVYHNALIRQGKDRLKPLLPAAYFPAFRTMIEAWSSKEENSIRRQAHFEEGLSVQAQATMFARASFGDFVPVINYPSPTDIEYILINEIQLARLKVAKTDSDLLSEVFIDVFASLSEDSSVEIQEEPYVILNSIQKLSKQLEESSVLSESSGISAVYARLRERIFSIQKIGEPSQKIAPRILAVYQKSLEKRLEVQKDAFAKIERYLNSVHQFLEGCNIEISAGESRQQTSVVLKFDDGFVGELKNLSSGERQIITLIYAATHMSSQKVVLIDEPEISLHVDWQRRLISKMAEQLSSRQIIACTHSPTIGADYEERIFALKPITTNSPTPLIEEEVEDIPF